MDEVALYMQMRFVPSKLQAKVHGYLEYLRKDHNSIDEKEVILLLPQFLQK